MPPGTPIPPRRAAPQQERSVRSHGSLSGIGWLPDAPGGPPAGFGASGGLRPPAACCAASLCPQYRLPRPPRPSAGLIRNSRHPGTMQATAVATAATAARVATTGKAATGVKVGPGSPQAQCTAPSRLQAPPCRLTLKAYPARPAPAPPAGRSPRGRPRRQRQQQLRDRRPPEHQGGPHRRSPRRRGRAGQGAAAFCCALLLLKSFGCWCCTGGFQLAAAQPHRLSSGRPPACISARAPAHAWPLLAALLQHMRSRCSSAPPPAARCTRLCWRCRRMHGSVCLFTTTHPPLLSSLARAWSHARVSPLRGTLPHPHVLPCPPAAPTARLATRWRSSCWRPPPTPSCASS